MISNLEEMKQFLQWCKETGIIAVKFDERPDPNPNVVKSSVLLPVDVVFKGTPAEGPLTDLTRSVPHEKFEEDGDIVADGVTYEEGEVVSDEDLYGPPG